MERMRTLRVTMYGDNWSIRGDILGFCSTNCSEKMGGVILVL